MPVSDPTLALPSRTRLIQPADLEIAMLDPLLVNLPGLFRTVPSVAYKRTGLPPLELGPYVFGESGLSISATCPAPLCGDDAQVLQTLACLAALQRAKVEHTSDKPHLPLHQKLLDQMHAGAKTRWLAHRLVSCSLSHMLKLLDWPVSGTYRARLLASLNRLSAVTITVLGDRPNAGKNVTDGSYQLLSHDAGNGSANNSRMVHVLLNPRQSRVIAGGKSKLTGQVPYVEISMQESRALPRNDQVRLIHQRLCAWINHDTKRVVTFGTVLKYAYSDDKWSAALPSHRRISPARSLKHRLTTVTKALNALEAALHGWSVQERNPLALHGRKREMIITRPKRKESFKRV